MAIDTLVEHSTPIIDQWIIIVFNKLTYHTLISQNVTT